MPTREEAPRLWKIVETSIDTEAGDTWLNLKLQDESGETDEAAICLEACDESRQAAGQKTLARLTSALGRDINNSEDLHGMWVFFDSQCEVQPAPANDNADRRAASFPGMSR
ncbi:MAG: hypothetical protein HPM95_15185 [Alphaproteobacteria bacterium]|nr:hypothetical protein [Alphaproteobacteria bacterium]